MADDAGEVSDLELISGEGLETDADKDTDTDLETEGTEEEVKDPDDLETDPEEEATEKDSTDEEDLDLDDLDDEDDTKDEDEVEVSASVRTSYKEITEKYPKFFKEFPDVRHAMAREQKYAELFPTVDDAVEANEKIEAYQQLDEQIMGGDVLSLLKNVHNSDRESYTKLVENFLPTVFQNDRGLYNKITEPIVISLLQHAAREGKKNRTDPEKRSNLELAAAHISNLFFDTPDVPEIKVRTEDPELVKARTQLKAKEEGIFQRFEEEVGETAQSLLLKEIKANLDPKNVIPGFMREALVDAIKKEVGRAMRANKAYTGTRDKLWNAARKDPSRAMRKKIVSTYINTARKLLGPIRSKHLGEALKALGKRASTTPNPKKLVGGTQKQGTSKVAPNRGFEAMAKDRKVSDRELLDAVGK